MTNQKTPEQGPEMPAVSYEQHERALQELREARSHAGRLAHEIDLLRRGWSGGTEAQIGRARIALEEYDRRNRLPGIASAEHRLAEALRPFAKLAASSAATTDDEREAECRCYGADGVTEPKCPGCEAESDDHAATVTGEVNALIDSLDEHVTHEDIARALAEFRDGPLRAALAAPVEVDEAKLADVLMAHWSDPTQGINNICRCGARYAWSAELAEHQARIALEWLRGEGR